MASENETIADIEQALRDGSIYDENGCFDSHEIADRLEAARKRQDEKISFVKRCLKILDVELTRWSNGEKPVMPPTALLCPVLNAREALGEDVIAVPKMETAHNAAAMREVLVRVRGWLERMNKERLDAFAESQITPAYAVNRQAKTIIEDNEYHIGQINAALAAPPRNCDVGTANEQSERMEKEICSKTHGCVRCPIYSANSDCSLKWAQMPYEAKEGGAK